MNKIGNFLLVLWAAAACLGTTAAGLMTVSSSGGHVGDDINVDCLIINHEGVAKFFRIFDGRNETLSQTSSQNSKYLVRPCNKTTSDISREDSTLTIKRATESDSGTYGCVLVVNGKINWELRQQINIKVKPVSSGADDTNPSSQTTTDNQKQGLNEQSSTKEKKDQSSQSTGLIAVVILLAIVVVTLSIALGVVCKKGTVKCGRQNIRNDGPPPDIEREGEAGGMNETQLTEVADPPETYSFIPQGDTVVQIQPA